MGWLLVFGMFWIGWFAIELSGAFVGKRVPLQMNIMLGLACASIGAYIAFAK